jgi:hypothetical protein
LKAALAGAMRNITFVLETCYAKQVVWQSHLRHTQWVKKVFILNVFFFLLIPFYYTEQIYINDALEKIFIGEE